MYLFKYYFKKLVSVHVKNIDF